jgi:PEP-CTERM motif
MKNFILILAVSALLFGVTKPAGADIVYTTFGPGNSYDTTGGVVISGTNNGAGYFAQANAFAPASTARLDSVSVPIFGQGAISILIAADASGNPGATVENLGSITPGFSLSIQTINSTAHPVLTAGTNYWLVLQPTDPSSGIDGGWSFSTPSTPPGERRTSPTGDWQTSPFGGEAFEIDGAAVPEPSSFILLILAAVGAVGWRGTRRIGRNQATYPTRPACQLV